MKKGEAVAASHASYSSNRGREFIGVDWNPRSIVPRVSDASVSDAQRSGANDIRRFDCWAMIVGNGLSVREHEPGARRNYRANGASANVCKTRFETYLLVHNFG